MIRPIFNSMDAQNSFMRYMQRYMKSVRFMKQSQMFFD